MKKKFKVRCNCISFQDIVILASNKENAKKLAVKMSQCPDGDMEFGEFLELEDWDKAEYEAD